MKNLVDKIKKAAIALGLLTLAFAPLEAQKKDSYYLEKAKDDNYCLSNQAKRYNHRIYKKRKNDKDYCVSNQAKRYNHRIYKKRKNDKDYCVSNQAKRYNRFLHNKRR